MITYAIGDIHGVFDRLELLLAKIAEHANHHAQEAKIIFVGDYIDRGPDSKKVIEYLMAHPEYVCLRGNHEEWLIQCNKAVISGTGNAHSTITSWLGNGGGSTMMSFGNDVTKNIVDFGVIPQTVWDWLEHLPLYYDDPLRRFVHAGIDPIVPLKNQTKQDMLWIRDPWLLYDTTWRPPLELHVVHGHTPTKMDPQQEDWSKDGWNPVVLGHRTNIDTGGVFGGRLTCAIFNDQQAKAIDFIQE